MKTISINDTLAVFVLSGGRLFIGRADGGLVSIELNEVRHLVDALICLASEQATEQADIQADLPAPADTAVDES